MGYAIYSDLTKQQSPAVWPDSVSASMALWETWGQFGPSYERKEGRPTRSMELILHTKVVKTRRKPNQPARGLGSVPVPMIGNRQVAPNYDHMLVSKK